MPDVKILVAHGQMPVAKLEEVMNSFADGKADMLLSTTIIESGIDMPSVNTMIVYRADMFGLAQLYQLRGRVGRSKVRGYEEEIMRIKTGEKAQETSASGDALHDWSPQITTGIPIMIPETYVRDLGVRLGLYKRIGDIQDKEGLLNMREELTDRFGKIPQEVENLLQTVEIKQMCYKANIAKIDAGMKGILISFHNNVFKAADKLLDFIAKQGGLIKVRADQKLFIEKNLESYALRIETIKKYVSKLVAMVE